MKAATGRRSKRWGRCGQWCVYKQRVTKQLPKARTVMGAECDHSCMASDYQHSRVGRVFAATDADGDGYLTEAGFLARTAP